MKKRSQSTTGICNRGRRDVQSYATCVLRSSQCGTHALAALSAGALCSLLMTGRQQALPRATWWHAAGMMICAAGCASSITCQLPSCNSVPPCLPCPAAHLKWAHRCAHGEALAPGGAHIHDGHPLLEADLQADGNPGRSSAGRCQTLLKRQTAAATWRLAGPLQGLRASGAQRLLAGCSFHQPKQARRAGARLRGCTS